MSKTALVWFRNDLRLSDNDALSWAVDEGYHILPFFHLEEGESLPTGGATKWWLHFALEDFSSQISDLGGQLIIGNPELTCDEALKSVIKKYSIEAVLWNRSYEPEHIKRDTRIKAYLKNQDIHAESFNSNLLFDPTKVTNKSGTPFKVFTPFWKSLKENEICPAPELDLGSISWAKAIAPLSVADLNLLPKIKWGTGFYDAWQPTRSGAMEQVDSFLPERASAYPEQRDRPDLEGTSKLSPYLHFGQIGPRELLTKFRATGDPKVESGVSRQLFWREFANHLLYHFNWTPTKPLYEKYADFPWEEDPTLVKAWQQGQTGYPMVDAAMRELWTTGWMHNRARMIVGSFLVKHLLQPWQEGAAWFWDTLVDANLANNTFGWQWVAGCGADGAPYFRVFNPITQGQKFDVTGGYVRKWCPELKDLPLKYLHCPWEATPLELTAAGVTLGKDYPHPVIEHPDGRKKALDAFAKWKDMS